MQSTKQILSANLSAAVDVWRAAVDHGAAPSLSGLVQLQDAWPFVTVADLPRDALFGDQDNLLSAAEGRTGVDINIVPVWKMGLTGKGVSIGVYDTAMDVRHQDLAQNIDRSAFVVGRDGSWSDPTRIGAYGDEHATSVAGIIGAARNDLGVVGVAYEAKLTPVNILGSASVDPAYFSEALRQQGKFDIANHSWGFAGSFIASPFDPAAAVELAGFAIGANSGRGGLGTIENVAAGNYRQYGLSTETNGLTIDRHVVVVGATDRYGDVAVYSSPGASLLVVAPSSGDDAALTTTDITGARGYSATAYNDTFGGTSAATPQLSGIEAVMLQANPLLGWRDVQTILSVAARHTGSDLGGTAEGYESEAWFFNHAANWNGGAMHFSNDYGFGLIDARAAVMLAATWSFVFPAAHTSLNERNASSVTTGAWDLGGISHTIEIAIDSHQSVEAMVLDLRNFVSTDAEHLSVDLISPGGTVSRLLAGNGMDGSTIAGGWRLMSRAFRGEDAYGVWTVTISGSADDTGALGRVRLTAFGSDLADSSVHFYTDEYAALWDASRALLDDPYGAVAIDAAPVTGDVVIDLRDGSGSIAAMPFGVAAGTLVRTIVTGSGNDAIHGDTAGLRVLAGAGHDTLIGSGGADDLRGAGGRDTIEGGRGADRLAGGAGIDTLSYAGAAAGVRVNIMLTRAQSTGEGSDALSGFENLVGSAFADRLIANLGSNRIEGGNGNDVLVGGRGADTLIGGDGIDTASYVAAPSRVRVDLSTGHAGGGAGSDFLSGIENVEGSAYADVLIGDAAANRLGGGGGGDILAGGGGADLLAGGDGNDRLIGGEGADLLSGGRGSDAFIFGSPIDGGDRILDFRPGADVIGVSRSGFGIGPTVSDLDFATWFVEASEATATGHGQFLYAAATGQLLYDKDGVGGEAATPIVSFLNRAPLRAADFDLF